MQKTDGRDAGLHIRDERHVFEEPVMALTKSPDAATKCTTKLWDSRHLGNDNAIKIQGSAARYEIRTSCSGLFQERQLGFICRYSGRFFVLIIKRQSQNDGGVAITELSSESSDAAP